MGLNEPSEIAQIKQRVSDIFDGAAATYDRVGPRFFSHFGRRLVEIAQIPVGSKILDVATGRGAVLFPAAKKVGSQGHVIGIDLSENMLQETKKELVRKNLSQKVEVRQMDAEHLQFSAESFDYVLCGLAIFFFPKPYEALAEFKRVLKPGGQIGLSIFDKQFYREWNWFYELANTYLPSEQEGTQETENEPEPVLDTPEGLEAFFNAAGFGDIQIFSETAEIVYETDGEFWSTLWSHGARETLEQIEQETGSDGLQKFKLAVFRTMSEIKKTDGLHQFVPVHVGLATKPKD